HAVRLAGLPGNVSPYTLRHTAVTSLMQRGALLWEATGFPGMSVEVLQYGHHHPDYMQSATSATIAKPGAQFRLLDDARHRIERRIPIVAPGRLLSHATPLPMARLPLPRVVARLRWRPPFCECRPPEDAIAQSRWAGFLFRIVWR